MSPTGQLLPRPPSCAYIRVHAGQRTDFTLREIVRPARYGWVRRRSFDKLFDTFGYVRPRSRVRLTYYVVP